MRPLQTAAHLLLLSGCLLPTTLAAQTIPEPVRLSRTQAAQLLARADELADLLDQQMRNPVTPRSPEETREALALAGLREVAVHTSEWRWYSRDGGVLVAIPVRERLGLVESVTTEQALAGIIAETVNQKGWGYPRVQIVFVEPEYPAPARLCPAGCPSLPVVACDCR